MGGVVGGGIIPPGDSVPSEPGGRPGEVAGGGVEPSGGVPSLGGGVVSGGCVSLGLGVSPELSLGGGVVESGAGLVESLGAEGSDSEGVEGSVVL
jgi:hypothetical protein